jgi:hypothetical protein
MATRFGDRPFVLCVGAIHARKNHRLLYDVWLRLAARMGEACPHLVLVGGVAWNGHDVRARAARRCADQRAGQHPLDDVDDAALDWLYAHCSSTVYPSLHEGWGLPVAESLRHGKLCLAADTSSVPEIAPGLVELIDRRTSCSGPPRCASTPAAPPPAPPPRPASPRKTARPRGPPPRRSFSATSPPPPRARRTPTT